MLSSICSPASLHEQAMQATGRQSNKLFQGPLGMLDLPLLGTLLQAELRSIFRALICRNTAAGSRNSSSQKAQRIQENMFYWGSLQPSSKWSFNPGSDQGRAWFQKKTWRKWSFWSVHPDWLHCQSLKLFVASLLLQKGFQPFNQSGDEQFLAWAFFFFQLVMAKVLFQKFSTFSAVHYYDSMNIFLAKLISQELVTSSTSCSVIKWIKWIKWY